MNLESGLNALRCISGVGIFAGLCGISLGIRKLIQIYRAGTIAGGIKGAADSLSRSIGKK